MNLLTRLKSRWDNGHISESCLKSYVRYKIITADDYKAITGKEYEE